ncbi:MAG: hypothetical protein Q9170_005600 [Blastenia crenularia]
MSEVARQPQGNGDAAPASSSSRLQSAIQAIGIFFLVQFLVSQFLGSGSSKNASSGGSSTVPSFDQRPVPEQEITNHNSIPQMIAPIWPMNSSLDISIYVTPSLVMPSLNAASKDSLVLEEKGFTLSNWKDNRQFDTVFKVPQEVQNNGTLWAHFYVALQGYPLDPGAPSYDISKAYHFFHPLNQVLPKKKVAKTRKLVGASDGDVEEVNREISTPTSASYYHPNFTMSFIPDSGTQSYVNMHSAIRQYIHLEQSGARDTSGQNGWYYPILFVNTFWQLRDHMIELNSTVKELPLHIDLNNLANWKFSLYASIGEGQKQNQKQVASGGPKPAGGDGTEFEEFKRVLIDTNIYLLSTTAIVTVLHMVFEGLAFKSDISHWRNKKDNVGISFRTILANVFMQTIVFLYLVDNSDGTSWMILFGQGVGILLEAWKITKTVDVRVREAAPDSWLPYKVTFEDKHKLSETEEKTKEYDEIAFRYLYMVAVPLLGAYAVYSLLYETHKSWYSFVITTLVGSVYAYGFLMMVPSLYINYRLKSVAHMPAKAMTYKFLNTFIDDLFAFTIKMPTLHRLATLRDDVIFFVYLYQAWAYKVDYTRINEFGQGGDNEQTEEKIASKPMSAAPEADSSVAKTLETTPPGTMIEYRDILNEQMTRFNKDLIGKKQVEAAVHTAQKLAEDLVNRGASQEEIKEQEGILMSELHRAMALLAPAWRNVVKAGRDVDHWYKKHDESVDEMETFWKERDQHQHGIERQKKRIQDLSTSLLKLQQRHTYQHPEKLAEKTDAIAKATGQADGREILEATTVYSSTKKGHERYAPIIARRTEEYLFAGKQLRDMTGAEDELKYNVTRLEQKVVAAVQRRHFDGNEHHVARVLATSKLEAVAAFLGVVGGDNAVTKAKESLARVAKLYEQNPDKGYGWACEQMVAAVEVTERVEEVKEKKRG